MALFNVKNLAGALQGAVDTVSAAAKDVKLPDVGLSGVKLPNPMGAFAAQGGETAQHKAVDGLCARDALKLFYYLMFADGEARQDEFIKFISVCGDLGVNDPDARRAIVDACDEQLAKNASAISPLFTAYTCVDGVLFTPETPAEGEAVVAPGLLVWNLLAMAYSDGSCDTSERELIGRIAKLVEFDDSMLLEMEDSILTLTDLEREQEWVKTTGRPYLTIESVVNEIETRKAAVRDNVMALIAG